MTIAETCGPKQINSGFFELELNLVALCRYIQDSLENSRNLWP